MAVNTEVKGSPLHHLCNPGTSQQPGTSRATSQSPATAPSYTHGTRGLEMFLPSRAAVHTQLWATLLCHLFSAISKVEFQAVTQVTL